MSLLNALSYLPVLPFAAILALLAYYALKRALWKRNRRRGKSLSGFCPSSAAFSVVFLFGLNFIRPSLAHVTGAIQREECVEDEDGDPETPEKRLHRQLRKIRRGETVDRLLLDLPAPNRPLHSDSVSPAPSPPSRSRPSPAKR